MVFSTREFANHPDARAARSWAALGFMLALITVACSPAQTEFGIQLADLVATDTANGFNVSARQEIRLSSEARSALRNGVPIQIRLDMKVRKTGMESGAVKDWIIYEIRYLPLSERYQLTGPSQDEPPRTFPRLRHVIAELASIEWRVEGIQSGPGHYKLSLRSQLDRTSMPGPMQLPMLFSSEWAHDSGWVSKDLEIL